MINLSYVTVLQAYGIVWSNMIAYILLMRVYITHTRKYNIIYCL